MPKRSTHSSGLISTKAIVISSLKYSEADLIVKCFTESHGLKSYLLRNILKSKKGKLRASQFQVLTQLEIVASHREKNTLENIREAKTIFPYQTLQTDIYKSSLVFFLAEVLRNSIQEEEENKPLYLFLEESFKWLDHATDIANFHLLFLVKLSRFLGFYPHDSKENLPCFNLLEGVFQKEETNKYCLETEHSNLLKTLLNIEFEGISSLKLNQTKRVKFLEVVLIYYEFHLENFRKPKSLEVLNQIFS